MLEPVGIFPVPAIGGSARRLDIGGVIGFRAQYPEKRARIKRPRAHFNVIRLVQGAPFGGPVVLQIENNVLKIHSVWVYQSLADKVNPPLAGEANSDSLLSRQHGLSTVKVIAHFLKAWPYCNLPPAATLEI